MSINALTNAAMSRRPDFQPANRTPKNLEEIANAAGGAPPATTGQDAASSPAISATAVGTALQTLTTYIPTEVLTLYVSAVAALGPVIIKGHDMGRWIPFFVFLAATPMIVWIAFATKIKAAGKQIPLHPKRWPIWEMTAATIAYTAWAFALPDSPFLKFKDEWYSPGLAGFLILVVSYGLGILAPLMQRELTP
jgi:hypothetical protein